MRRDIEICGENGINGIVLGILGAGGTIDIERTSKLIELAAPMPVTFHRAFDMCSDPVQGLEDIIATGAVRLLTSGQKNNAKDGIELIREMAIQAGERMIIMPGGGIDETNIAIIASSTKTREFHLTGRKTTDSQMIFRKEGVFMGNPEYNEYTRKVADVQRIKKIITILQAI
jgi:copper homeostasis protein